MNITALGTYLLTVIILSAIEKRLMNYEHEYRQMAVFFVPLSVIVLISAVSLIYFDIDALNFWMAMLTGFPIGLIAQYVAHRNRLRLDNEIQQLKQQGNNSLNNWGAKVNDR